MKHSETNVAVVLAIAVMEALTNAAHDIAFTLFTGAKKPEDVLSTLSENLDYVQDSAKNFQGLISNFEGLCESLNETSHKQEASA